VLYLYDLNAKDKKKFNRVKRLFYYHLNQLPLKKELWKTKSALAVKPKLEKIMDVFFKKFSKNIIVYKATCVSIEQIE
jgi:hypothetical protein